MRFTDKERKVLTDFFNVLREYNEACVAMRRGATPKGRQDQLLAKMEGEMIRVCREAIEAFGPVR